VKAPLSDLLTTYYLLLTTYYILPVRPQKLGAVAVRMNRRPGWIKVTVDKDADNPFHAARKMGLLGYKKRGFLCPAFLAQGRGGIFRVHIACNRKNDRHQIFFGKLVPQQQIVVQRDSLFLYISGSVKTPGRAPKGEKPFFTHIVRGTYDPAFPPDAVIMNITANTVTAPKNTKSIYPHALKR